MHIPGESMENEPDVRLAQWFQENRERLINTLHSRIPRDSSPLGYVDDDLIQETFIKCMKNISQHNTDKDFFSWVAEILINLAKEKYNKARTLKRNEQNHISLDESLDGLSIAEVIPSQLASPVETIYKAQLLAQLRQAILIMKKDYLRDKKRNSRSADYAQYLEWELKRFEEGKTQAQMVASLKSRKKLMTLSKYKAGVFRAMKKASTLINK